MKTKNWLHPFTSIIVALALFLQFIAPAVFPLHAAVARQDTARTGAGFNALSEQRLPLPSAHPLSISRVQSGYAANNTLVLTYHITNNLPPTLQPDIPTSTPLTDTVELLAAFPLTDDMNTLVDPVLELTLTNGTLVDANGGTVNGNTITWNLPRLLPQASQVVTLTVAAPAAAPDFIDLDNGAHISAWLWGETVSATARPSTIIPDAIDPAFTLPTVDADALDGDMLWAAAAFAQEPVAAFYLVRGFAYDPYKGSLRGTRGTLWGEAGNSLDQSSLLIALLRAAGIPARYRHGSLNTADAQTLLASMFAPAQGLAGYQPEGTAVADPVNDPALLALAQDHWWVEAYLPGQGWTDLDPSFAQAQAGDIFATPGANDRIAEIPDNLRHKVYLELEVEQYNTFPVGGANLTTFVPLTGTFATAQIAAKAVILGHLVESDAEGGMVYTTVEHTYTPYFGINGDEFVEAGEPFADFLTNFPLASTFTTAEWLTFALTDADGQTQTFTRPVKDLIGPGVRLLGGNLNVTAPAEDEPFITFGDSFTAVFLPNHLRNNAFARRQQAALQQDVVSLAQAVDALPRDDLSTPAAETQADHALLQIEIARALLYGLSGLEFARQADPLADDLQANLGLKLFYAIPRIIIMQGASVQAAATRSVDLRNTQAQAIVAPGRPLSAARTAQWVKAVAESYYEGDALRDPAGDEPVTTARIFEAAQAQGLGFVYVRPDQMDLLDLYLPDPNAYGYAAAALIEGKEVLIPQTPVLLDGEFRLGWWEIDPVTGTAVSVLDDGTHGALIEYATMIAEIAWEVWSTWDDFGESVHQLWFDCIVDNVVPALQGDPGGGSGAACLDDWEPPGGPLAGSPDPWFYLPAHLCPIDNCGLEQYVAAGYEHARIPLPQIPFQYRADRLHPAQYAGQVIPVTDGGGGGDPTFSLTPSGPGTLLPLAAYGLDITAQANFDGELDVWTYVPPGWSVGFTGSDQVQIVAPEGTAVGDYTLTIVGQSRQDRSLVETVAHTVTVPAQQALDLAYQPEPNITIPVGPPSTAVSNQTNDGEAEMPDSAFRLDLFNQSSVTKTIILDITGAPAGWIVLNGLQQTMAVVTLPPFHRTYVGLYVLPPTRPSPGTSFTMNVTASDGGTLSDNVSIPWTMPGQAHNQVLVAPALLFMEPGGSQTFDLTLTNVGNAAGSFPVTATVPVSSWAVSNVQTPVSLNVDESSSQQPTLQVGAEAELGRRYPLWLASAAPGSYTQYALAEVQIVSPLTEPVYRAAAGCNLGSQALSAALESLAYAMTDLENSCNGGACDLAHRDEVVAAAHSVATYAAVSPLVTADVTIRSVADLLATHTGDGDILADMGDLSTAVAALNGELCEIGEHAPDVRFDPYLTAVLLGETAVFSLTVSNEGTLTTTYAVTATTPTGVSTFNPEIAPGAAVDLPLATAPAALGSYDILAAAVPTGPDVQLPLADTAVARLNVVDKFVQVTAVTADPPFVETGNSSTDLSVTVANVAGVAQAVTAHAEILAGDGSLQWSDDVPLNLLIGNPRPYALGTVNTSGWPRGAYTITVDLGLPDGVGFGYLTVGEAVSAAHSVSPALVPPGDVTATTHITTALTGETILPPPATQTLVPWPPRPPLSPTDAQPTIIGDSAAPEDGGGAQPITDNRSPITDHPSLQTTWAITRTENSTTAVTYTGAWTPVNDLTSDHASNGDYHRSQTTGDYASFNFNGTWIGVGLATSSASGYAEIFVDGASHGLVDLYSRGNDVRRVTIDNLPDAGHVITVTVTGLQNPFSSNDRVSIDYFDTWDGTTMPDGAYEQDHGRVWLSDGWVNQNDANASGGSYYRNGHTAWFPFTGSSITFQAMTHANAEKVAVYLDDEFQRYLNLADFGVHTETLTFDGLAAGPHMLTVRTFQGAATIDLFTTPATEPATPPPVIGSFHRYEEYDPSILYNGFPYPQTETSWSREFNDTISGHYLHNSDTAGDTVQFDFTGTAVIVGLYAETRGGYAELFLDGVSQGVIDTYRRRPTVLPLTFDGLANTGHTLTMTVLGQANPYATNDLVYLDYIDVWDGTPLPDGTFEEVDGRLYRSYRWSLINDAQASGGQYLQDAITGSANVWFPFTGDSISFRTLASSQGSQWTKINLDGQPLAEINLYNNTAVSRTYSFDNLGPGLHVLHLERYRGELMVDAFTTPGAPPFYQTPVYTGVVRYEEHHPALRYNGFPYEQMKQTWSEQFQGPASGGYTALSDTAGDTVSLTFDGHWASVGFYTHQYGGQAEIFVDGLSQGIVGLYSPGGVGDVESFTVGNLVTGTHTISITVLGLVDPPGTQARVHLDYIDVWDGQTMPDAIANASQVETNGRVHPSTYLNTVSSANAINGDYLVNSAGNPETNVWYAFTGDSFTFYGLSTNFGTSLVDVFVDDQFIETVDLVYPFSLQPLAFHFDGLGEGPHVARISNNAGSRVDAFASNQPPIGYRPLAEWWESDRMAGGSIFGGLHVPPVVGDVTGDGRVEIAIPSSNWDHQGELFLLNGDGSDAGGGDPIIWSVPFDIFNGFEDVGAPAVAELDGQPGAEIVMATVEGMYAFHSDGSTYWFTDTLQSNVFFGTPAIGNLDLDTAPEIVINLGQTLAVFEPDGALAWSFNDADSLTMPLLADLTGDGLLDILVHDWNDTLYLYDYNLGNPQLVWTAVFNNTPHGYGAPAVADLDQDGTPEVAIATETALLALNGEDGTVQWSAPLDPGSTGGVTIADIDGDGVVELVTGVNFNGGTLYAFEAGGSLKWAVPALDGSPLNTAAADLDGDGAYELLWNGASQGFTIYDGRTGAILFNDPLIVSATGSDVPVAADVDRDGYAEIVVPAQGGIRIVGFDGVWGPARPLWNQLNYHVTNIEDDLSVPFGEVNSWDVHNTYRTQTDLVHPLPDYQVVLTHTAAVTGVSVLSSTFNVPPTTAADPVYGWEYGHTAATPVVTRTFQSALSGLAPGEVRRVAEGTQVAYTQTSGSNRLALPPLYVTAARLASLEPAAQTRPAGSTAVYTLTLTNAAATPDNYTLVIGGPLAGWTSAPAEVLVPAHSSLAVPLTVTLPTTAVPATLPLLVDVSNGGGGSDQTAATLTLVDGVDVALVPPLQTAAAGEPVSYTLTISNLENTAQTYALSAGGLAQVNLPPPVPVPAGEAVTVTVTAAGFNQGGQPFTVLATAGSGAAGRADGVVSVMAAADVELALAPNPVTAGPGSTAVMTLTVINAGSLPDSYDLSLALPPGWDYALLDNGQPVSAVTLPPGPFNRNDLTLLVTPDVAATMGDYDVVATAVSQSDPAVTAQVSGTVQVGNRGVQISILSGPTTVDPQGTAVWEVQVTNTGQVADVFDLHVAGLFALVSTFPADSVALSPGESQTLFLTAVNMGTLLPGVADLVVAAQSQTDGQIISQDSLVVTILGYEAVAAEITPLTQTVTDTLTATFTLIVTNTGNLHTLYQFSSVVPGASGSLDVPGLLLPAHSSARLLLTVVVPGGGTYDVTATAVSESGGASANAAATLVVIGEAPNQPPAVNAGPDQSAAVGDMVQFAGAFTDPDTGDTHTIEWDFGDGDTAVGTLTPGHDYATAGVYTVTLTVTDSAGNVGTDTAVITVTEDGLLIYLPVMRKP